MKVSKQDHVGKYEVNAVSGDTLPVNRSILGSGTRAVTSYSSLGHTGGGGGGGGRKWTKITI
jgi:hypothetical protein